MLQGAAFPFPSSRNKINEEKKKKDFIKEKNMIF